MRQLLITILLVFILDFGVQAQSYFSTSVIVEEDTIMVVELTTTGIIIAGQSNPPYNCPWGYNFDISFDYSIKFLKDGSEVDYKNENIYTLQGEFTCNGKTSSFDLPNSSGNGAERTTGNISSGASDCETATAESLMCNEIDFFIEFVGFSEHIIVSPSAPPPNRTHHFRRSKKRSTSPTFMENSKRTKQRLLYSRSFCRWNFMGNFSNITRRWK